MPTVKELHATIKSHNNKHCVKGYSGKRKKDLLRIVGKMRGEGTGAPKPAPKPAAAKKKKKRITPTLVSAGAGAGGPLKGGGAGTDGQKGAVIKLNKLAGAYSELMEDANPHLAF
jgi:hypothetical protein